jgi:uroporphyrinogen decarboxylase
MNSKQRLAAVSRGDRADRIPFLPTIFEHSARLIGRTPSETALDEGLLEEAQVKAYEIYGHDAVTVGIDVYNIEAEALGCKIRYHQDNSIPGVISHPFVGECDFESITFSLNKGRIKNILNAAKKIYERIGSEVSVGVAISGPFSVSIELAGYESIMMDCIDADLKIHKLLEAVFEFQKLYCDEIIKRGLGVSVFESWATLPLVSPSIYKEFVMPYEKELIRYIKSKTAAAVPLVIGGDTTLILDDILETGTTLLVADYNADIEAFVKKASKADLLLRGNIDPKLVQKGTEKEIIHELKRILNRVNGYPKFVLGTGVIPYDTPTENLLVIKKYLEGNS